MPTPSTQQPAVNAMNAANTAIAGVHASWRKYPLSRDKADTLLLLGACLLVLVPHVAALPWWTSACCAMLLLWRGWLTLTGRRLPQAWILLPVALLLMLGVFLTFRTFFGREAGVTMVALLLACKLLEMRAKRDLFVVIFLSFFVLLSSFFYSQTIVSAAMALLATATLLTAQLSFQYTGVIPSLWQRAKLGALILLLAIPLTVVCFFLFPRIQGPLWSLPGDANSARSGLSESMSPGNISNLALSEDIAFRVKFSPATPEKSRLYWRGIVLNRFDGRTWSREDVVRASRPASLYRSKGKEIHQEIILEASGQAWLFALDIPGNAPVLEDTRTSLNTQFEIFSARSVNSRLRYQASSFPEYALQTELTPRELQTSVELPPGSNPKTRDYAQRLSQRIEGHQQRIDAVLQLFRQEKFIYTLEPPLLGDNSVDDFLFASRAGFCEHYSSAFVVLMRSMGIPARVVTGYQGGTPNNIDGYLEVRQSDAHAWAEVWLAGRGWVRIDPTAAVAPERVMQNLFSTQPRRGMAGLVNLAMGNNSLLQSIRMRWDAVNNSWNLWILNYSQARQMDFMRYLGLSGLDWPQLALIFFSLAMLAMAIVALPLMRNRPQISALDQLYLSMCQRLEGKGIVRAAHEGPAAFMQRLQVILPEAQYALLRQFFTLYIASKYGKQTLPEASAIQQLRTLLAQYRRLYSSTHRLF